MEITLKEIEIATLNLAPGDTLMVKLTGPEFGDEGVLDSLQKALKIRFPNNKIMVFYIPEGNAMSFEKIAEPEANGNVADDCSIPTNYCNDCGCGKKERILAERGE